MFRNYPRNGFNLIFPANITWQRFTSILMRSTLADGKSQITPMNYLLQCGLATVSLGLILLVEDAVFRAAIVVGVASTAFTIFVFPSSIASTPRKVIGGHTVAIVTALMISSLLEFWGGHSTFGDTRFAMDVAASLSVGLSALFMVVTSTQHPPAAATAFGLVIYPWSGSAVIVIVSSAIILSVVRIVLRPKLVDLL